MDLRAAASLPVLLAAYRAEKDGSDEALTAAQNIVERLIDGDVFGRLQRIRDDLDAGRHLDGSLAYRALSRALNNLDDLLNPPED